MTRAVTSLLIACLGLAGAASGEEIAVSNEALDNLGVVLEAPVPAVGVAAVEATARVVVPPEGEVILNTTQEAIVSRVFVSAGDRVEAGQVLAELSSPGFLELQRDFLDAVNSAGLAAANYRRDLQLNAEGIISERRLQESRTAQRLANAQLAEHRALLAIAGLTGGQIDRLESQQALEDILELRSPLAGEVVERRVTTGEHVDAMAPLFRLVDLETLWLEIQVPQERAAGIREGMAVTGIGGDFEAQVIRIGRAVDSATQSVVVRALVTAGAETLLPGQFLAVRFLQDTDASAEGSAWAVPAAALSRSGRTTVLFVRTAGGFEVRQVEVLGADRDLAIVSGPLDAGERLAVSGIPALKAIRAAGEE